MNKTCVIICGPTAVGKTGIAIALAKQLNTEIISADSRQCFKELDIAVAKPTPPELQDVHHYFINSHSIQENISAADFENYALDAVEKIFKKNELAVMVGGTGLYIKAFCEGMDDMPGIDPEIRKKIIDSYNDHGIKWLREQTSKHDPDYFEKGETGNPQRMMRALEVKLSTGRSILSFHTKQKKERGFEIIKIGLELPREIIYQRINDRVDHMMEKGLLEEARSLYPFKHLNALQTVGYRELFDHFDGRYSLARAVELIKQNSRNYAKRQMTWFKKDPAIKWMEPGAAIVYEYIKEKMSR